MYKNFKIWPTFSTRWFPPPLKLTSLSYPGRLVLSTIMAHLSRSRGFRGHLSASLTRAALPATPRSTPGEVRVFDRFENTRLINPRTRKRQQFFSDRPTPRGERLFLSRWYGGHYFLNAIRGALLSDDVTFIVNKLYLTIFDGCEISNLISFPPGFPVCRKKWTGLGGASVNPPPQTMHAI